MLLLSLTVSEAALNNPIVCVAQNIEMKFILFCFIGTAEEGDLEQFRPSWCLSKSGQYGRLSH